MLLREPGAIACALIGLLLLTFALTVDFPKVAFGFQSDEATYYSMGHSLAEDGDFAYRREDLARVWKEFRSGPEGIFLKRGKTVRLETQPGFPFIGFVHGSDPRTDRLYYGKSFTYPLAAAPFIALFGTNGFLVLHAILLTLALGAAYAFLRARAPASVALAFSLVFFFASAAPVYFVWLTPELFNLCLTMCGLFLWAYKEVAPPLELPPASPRESLARWTAWAAERWSRWSRSPASTYAGVLLIGIATFSKPTNIVVAVPVILWPFLKRRWTHGLLTGTVFGATVAALFLMNLLVTGEFNYQGGERNTFYGGIGTGFPFQTQQSTFDSGGLPRSTNAVPTDVLFSTDALLSVLPRNIVYFTLGRHTGLVPYFFPGMVCAFLFLWARREERRGFQWVAGGAFVAACLALIVYMPFTYSGGGGPVGNRYFLGFYPLLLFLAPPMRHAGAALLAMGIGGLFTAQLVLNPFYVSYYPAEHMKTGAYRWLPVELSLVNDLPVNVTPRRAKQRLAGEPPLTAYFLDDSTYDLEGEWFWVRGERTAQIIVRAPVRTRPDGSVESLRLRHLTVEVRSGDVANEVTIQTGGNESRLSLEPHGSATATIKTGSGLPYKPMPELPTNYVYLVTIRSKTGFTPLFTSGTGDSRHLGAMIRLSPSYE